MGAPLVGLAAEHVFGFKGVLGAKGAASAFTLSCIAHRHRCPAAAASQRSSNVRLQCAPLLWGRPKSLAPFCRHSPQARHANAGRVSLPSLPCPTSPADGNNVKALGSALLVCMVVPWTMCLIFFTGGGAAGTGAQRAHACSTQQGNLIGCTSAPPSAHQVTTTTTTTTSIHTPNASVPPPPSHTPHPHSTALDVQGGPAEAAARRRGR